MHCFFPLSWLFWLFAPIQKQPNSKAKAGGQYIYTKGSINSASLTLQIVRQGCLQQGINELFIASHYWHAMKQPKPSRVFREGPPGVAPRLVFGSFPPEHTEFAYMYLTCKPSLLPCREDSSEACKEQQQQTPPKSATHHVFRGLWKWVFKACLHFFFIFLGPSHCQEKGKNFCKLTAGNKYPPHCDILDLWLQGEKEEICKTDKAFTQVVILKSPKDNSRAGDAACLPSKRRQICESQRVPARAVGCCLQHLLSLMAHSLPAVPTKTEETEELKQ